MAVTDWSEGERVLAPWEQEWLYPGVVRCIDDDIAFIRFDDGDRGLIPLSELCPIAVKPGTIVQARRDRSELRYEPATVLDVDGEQLRLRYEDDEEDAMAVSYVRVPVQSRKW